MKMRMNVSSLDEAGFTDIEEGPADASSATESPTHPSTSVMSANKRRERTGDQDVILDAIGESATLGLGAAIPDGLEFTTHSVHLALRNLRIQGGVAVHTAVAHPQAINQTPSRCRSMGDGHPWHPDGGIVM